MSNQNTDPQSTMADLRGVQSEVLDEYGSPLFGNATDGSPMRRAVPFSDPLGHYAALGLAPDADDGTIRKAYRQLSNTFHPDKHSNASPETQRMMAERFQRVNAAYQVLGDPRSRISYDNFGQAGVDRLPLIPETVTDPQRLVKILGILQRESDLKTVAKMVNTHTSMKIDYNISGFLGVRKYYGHPTVEQPKKVWTRRPAKTTERSISGRESEEEEELAWNEAKKKVSEPEKEPSKKEDEEKKEEVENTKSDNEDEDEEEDEKSEPETEKKEESDGEDLTSTKVPSRKSITEEPKTIEKREEPKVESKPEPITQPSTPPDERTFYSSSQEKAPPPPPAAAPARPTGPVKATMRLHEVEIDGKKQIVLIPPEEVIPQLRAALQNRGTVGASAGHDQGPPGTVLRPQAPQEGHANSGMQPQVAPLQAAPGSLGPLLRQELFIRWMKFIPTGMSCSHSFQQTIGANTLAVFRALGSHQQMGGSGVECGVDLEHHWSPVTTWLTSIRASLQGFRCTLSCMRELSKLWTLTTKLKLVDLERYLTSFTVDVSRKLTPRWTLINSLKWTTGKEGGNFSVLLQKRALRGDDLPGTPTEDRQHQDAHWLHGAPSELNLGQFCRFTFGLGTLSVALHREDLTHIAADSIWSFGRRKPKVETKKPQEASEATPAEAAGSPQGSDDDAEEKEAKKHPRSEDDDTFGQSRAHYIISYDWQADLGTRRMVVGTDFLYQRADHVCFGLGVSSYLPLQLANGTSVTQLSFVYRRGRQKIQIPMILSMSQQCYKALVLMTAPFIFLKLGKLLILPQLEKRRARKLQEERAEMDRELQIGIRRAAAEQAALESTVESIRNNEKKEDGLVIESAEYGVLRPRLSKDSYKGSVPLTIDVTAAVQSLVRNSQIRLGRGARHQLPGFMDPHPPSPYGDVERKGIKVRYLFQGRKHEGIIWDNEELLLPLEHHIISS